MFRTLRNKNLLLLFAATGLMFISFSVLMPTLPVFLHDRGASHFIVGLIVGGFPVGVLSFRAVAGWMVTRFGRKRSLALATAASLVIPAAYAATLDQGVFLVAVRVVHGALLGIFTTAMMVYVVDSVRPESRGSVISEMSIANYVGIAIGPALAEALYSPGNLTYVLVVMGASSALALAMLRGIQESATFVRESAVAESSSQRWLTAGVLVASAVYFLAAVGHGAAFTFVPLLIDENQLGSSGSFFAIFSVATLIVRTLGRDLPDRFPRNFLSCVSLVAFAAALGLLALAPGQGWVWLAAVLYGVSFGVFQPALTALVADMTSVRTRGPVMGVFMAAFDGGFIVAGLLLGHVADLVGVRKMLLLSAVAPLLGALTLAGQAVEIRRLRRRQRGGEPGGVLEAVAVGRT